MAKKTERVTIGGTQYTITQLGAVEGRGLFKKFATAIGPLLREVVSGPVLDDLRKTVLGEKSPADEAPEQPDAANKKLLATLQLVAPLAIRALEDLPPELFEEMCATFAPSCTVGNARAANGQAVFMPLDTEFDQHFAGDYVSMTAWLGHCVRVNGFLGKLGGAKAQPAGTATAP
jgi:hypothetical protein